MGTVGLVIRLVIFDCDGVLVDTEPIANRVLAELVSAEGLPTTTADSMRRYMGRSMPAVLKTIEIELGRELGPAFADEYYRRIFAAFDEDLTEVPGAAAAVDALERAGLAVCVASSGPHEKMRRTLGRTGLLPRFEGRIFSATEVERGKPFPDLFLHAASRMEVEPGACVVVEDSPAGVAAARAAGMRAIGLAGPLGVKALIDAGAEPIERLDDLLEVIEGTRLTAP